MNIERYLQNLSESLTNAAASSSEQVQEAADRLARTMESSLRLTLVEFASDLADDITVKLDGDAVDVRFRGGSPEVVVTRATPEDIEETTPMAPPPPPPPVGEDADISRISLRIPEHLKTQVEAAAASEALSTNAWLVRAAQRALAPQQPPSTRSGRRMTGWVQ